MTIDNEKMETLHAIYESINNNMLGTAIKLTRQLVANDRRLLNDSELILIEADYGRMLEYMQRNQQGKDCEQVYASLLSRLYHFVSTLHTKHKNHNVVFFSNAKGKALPNDADMAWVACCLKEAGEHQRLVEQVFNTIVASSLWTDDERTYYEALLLSEQVALRDRQTLVSAVTLAVMNTMDTNKFFCLVNIYRSTNHEALRQRALVGWVFALAADVRIQPEIEAIVANIFKGDDKDLIVSELVEMQKQMIFCTMSEDVSDTIKKDIIPDLMQNNINITRFGFAEKEDDPLADILDPSAEERQMDKVEETFNRIMDMQRAGSDIYFGGFSQMKRFPFFYKLSNWFCPFYSDHPDLQLTREKIGNAACLDNIGENGPFCDSDKYSFALSLASVVDSMPPYVRDMLSSREMFGPIADSNDKQTPTFLRRMILQDMYRFFRLYPDSRALVNPFDEQRLVFIADEMFDSTPLPEQYEEIAAFAIKQRSKPALTTLMRRFYYDDDPKNLMFHAVYELDFMKDPEMATKYLCALCDMEPDNKRALRLLARAYVECEYYADALDCYEDLLNIDPNNPAIMLNHCVLLSKTQKYDEAVAQLYKLNFENPESLPVRRVLAWSLMGQDKLTQAWREYDYIHNSQDAKAGAWQHAGYCQWFLGCNEQAVTLFKHFLERNRKDGIAADITEEFAKDQYFISAHNISNVESYMMIDLVQG